MEIVKKNGTIQELDKLKILKYIDKTRRVTDSIAITEAVVKEIEDRFDTFYCNTHNIEDIIEKHIMLYDSNVL
tara:strand:- start:3385 stop:3603 length:219 start_codon:yes stop_codon:yes gene_type:complete